MMVTIYKNVKIPKYASKCILITIKSGRGWMDSKYTNKSPKRNNDWGFQQNAKPILEMS